MGDNLVPNGLSIGCKVITPGSIQLTANAFDWMCYGVTHSWAWPLLLGPRFRRQPRAAKAAPLRALGVDRSARPSNGLSCQDCRKARLGQRTEFGSETWVTGFGPNGLSRGCKVFCSRSKYPRS